MSEKKDLPAVAAKPANPPATNGAAKVEATSAPRPQPQSTATQSVISTPKSVPTKAVAPIAAKIEPTAPAKPSPVAPARAIVAKAATKSAPAKSLRVAKAVTAKARKPLTDTKSITRNKETKIMATTANTAFNTAAMTDKAQTILADAQGRAKSAMEKGARFYEELGELTKGNVEAMIASSKVATSAVETLGQDVAAYGKQAFEQASAAFKGLTSVKSPTELFQLQSDYARSAFDNAVAEGSRMSEKLAKIAGDVVQPLSSRVAVAADKMKAVAL